MGCSDTNITFSLNRKKRWLLPEIIEERILESVSTVDTSPSEREYLSLILDDDLKIMMYENENVHYHSSCVRYANSQMKPRVIDKNGRVFNSNTLAKWLNFETQSRRRRRRPADGQPVRVNMPKVRIEQRPGLFLSEVTYEFLYPRPCGPTKHGRSLLTYHKPPEKLYHEGRQGTDTSQNRRHSGRVACARLDIEEELTSYLGADEDSEAMCEHQQWSSQSEDSSKSLHDLSQSSTHTIAPDDTACPTVNFPMDCFILTYTVPPLVNSTVPKVVIDRKAHKYYEPPSTSDGILLCSIACANESDFLAVMQQTARNISQANLSPPTFLQRTPSSSFSVIYTYSRSASLINARLHHTGRAPTIVIKPDQTTLTCLVDLVNEKLSHSSPLPMDISKQEVLVQSHATDKPTILSKEKIMDESNEQASSPAWFNTIHHDYAMLECSVCCEALTENDAYELLPCTSS